MEISVDRRLGVSIRQQIKGLIEYGIACGELAPGETLPSVRDLAKQAGVAPMTIVQVYAELKDQGLIESWPGSRTVVADRSRADMLPRTCALDLRKRVDDLIDHAASLGVGVNELSAMITARLSHRGTARGKVTVILVALFSEATARYAALTAARLGDQADVGSLTIDALRSDSVARARANTADLVVTLVNRQTEVAHLLPEAKIVAVRFIPSEETRRALASIPPLSHVTAVSKIAEFFPVLLSGVKRFTPQAAEINGANLDAPELGPMLAGADVVVYASGADRVLDFAHSGARVIEYTHDPDPADIESIVLPAVRSAAAAMRSRLSRQEALVAPAPNH